MIAKAKPDEPTPPTDEWKEVTEECAENVSVIRLAYPSDCHCCDSIPTRLTATITDVVVQDGTHTQTGGQTITITDGTLTHDDGVFVGTVEEVAEEIVRIALRGFVEHEGRGG